MKMQLAALALSFLSKDACAARTSTTTDAAYEEFRKLHRPHTLGADEIDGVPKDVRRTLYVASAARVHAHNNRRPAPSWRMGLNQFGDYTEVEQQQMLGHQRRGRYSLDAPSALIQLDDGEDKEEAFGTSFDWGSHGLKSAKDVHNQGACGSCWAHAAAGAIEIQLERSTGNASRVSTEQITACTPNPQKCGGTGGCSGATAELGFDYVKNAGLALDGDYPGTFKGNCAEEMATTKVAVGNWVRLPENDQQALMKALTEKGPVAVSVDASNFFLYHDGIFADCEKDAVVNHAVLMVGYGEDDGKLYWKIRNSWGGGWGEEGHIRLLRHKSGDEYCGTDHEPEKGVGCEGGPRSLPVCGMCGVLSDSSYPDGVTLK